MKKLFLLFAVLFCAAAAVAATATKNTMKMVAYFPVPYVAYDTVSATQSMDLGILNKCDLSLGENKSNLGGKNCSLLLHGTADSPNDVQRGLLNVSSGKLDLSVSGFEQYPLIKSAVVLAGSGGQPSYGWLDIGRPEGKEASFKALYISSLANKGNSLRATQEANVTEFKMFDEISGNFPACNGTATWKELELGGNTTKNQTYKDVYLVCGDVVAAPPESPCANEPKKTHWNGSACVCPNTPSPKREEFECRPPSKGKQYRTWNDNTCEWDITDNCTNSVWKKATLNGQRVSIRNGSIYPLSSFPCEDDMGTSDISGQSVISSCQSLLGAGATTIKEGDVCNVAPYKIGHICFDKNKNCGVYDSGTRVYADAAYKCE